MKALYCKSALLLAALTITAAGLQSQTVKKDFHKEVSATASSELAINNQFGNVTVNEWDQDKIVIDVNVEVTMDNEAKAQSMLDKITVEFKEEGSKLSATTKMEKSDFKGERKKSFKINYTVKCPKAIKLDLENQFGDVILGSFAGEVKVDLQFGTLNAVSLSGPSNSISVQFGKVTVTNLKDAKLDVQHGEGVTVSEAGNLKVEAQFANIELGKVVALDAELNHGDLKVENLTGSLKMECNMGNCKFGNIAAGFQSVTIEQNMGDISLIFDPKASYQLNAEVNMGSLKVPEGIKADKEDGHKEPGNLVRKVTGSVGSGSAVVKINGSMGSVQIK